MKLTDSLRATTNQAKLRTNEIVTAIDAVNRQCDKRVRGVVHPYDAEDLNPWQ